MRFVRVEPVAATSRDGEDRRTHELETLHRLGHAIARTLDEREVLEQGLRTLVEMGWFACGEAFRVVDDQPEAVAAGACSAVDDPDACPLRAGLAGPSARAIADGRPRREAGWWLVPVERRALLALAAREGDDDVSGAFLAAVADLVASALRRAALHERLAEKERQRARLLGALMHAQEEERGRISRDLHDQIGQALTGLLLGLDAAIEAPDEDELRRLKALTGTTLADVRRIALDLRPSVLDELGVEAAVRRLARDLQERHGLDVQVTVRLPRLAKQVETVLYRVVQEALTNVVRHARARSVSVVATASEQQLQVVVEDDGIGFDEARVPPADKLGLMGMRERMELLGGSLRVESAPGRGTTVYARLPRR
jgi:signal transduction histidine kinase